MTSSTLLEEENNTCAAEEEEEDLGPITREFIAHLNSGILTRTAQLSSAGGGGGGAPKKNTGKRAREDVTSRSRQEIIDWVLANDELIRVCICPYCLKIHSRRDNARVHIKNQHPGLEIRDFDVKRDATLSVVRHVNRTGKFAPKRSRISPAPSSTLLPDDSHFQPDIKVFNGGDTLQNFLMDIDKQVRKRELEELNGSGEASTSGGCIDAPNSSKESREPSPNCSLLGELNGTPDSSSQPHLFPFGCVFCPCSFPRVRDLTSHVSHVHRTRFRCNLCLAEFVRPEHLEDHYSISHVIGAGAGGGGGTKVTNGSSVQA